MAKGKGYLLPAGDASEDDLACALVFYPARDEYRRALMGSLDYLATWIAWERDSEKRGQDAAASWKLANIQTWSCSSMTFCDDLATNLESILAAITALECCGDQDLTDGDQYTDPIVDGEGDVPQNIIDAGYAEDAADWDGFDDYKCMISHLAVDHVETFFREISPHISDTGIVFGGVGVIGALLGAILVVAGLPLAGGIILALGASAAIWRWISTYGKDAVDDLADEIALYHDDLACAIYESDGVSAAIANFNTKVDFLFSSVDAVAIKAINIGPQLKAMYGGRYDQEDVAGKMEELGYELEGYDCTCMFEYDFLAVWDNDMGSGAWQLYGRSNYNGDASCPSNQNVKFNNCNTGSARSGMLLEFAATKAEAEWPEEPRIGWCHQAELTYTVGDNFASEGKTLTLKILYQDASFDTVVCPVTPGEHTVQIRGSDTKEVQADDDENYEVFQVIGNATGVCNDIDAQVCISGARLWGSVLGT